MNENENSKHLLSTIEKIKIIVREYKIKEKK
jgi:hypothetical protein